LALSASEGERLKLKGRYLLQHFLHESDSWLEALYNLRSGSSLAWANDTAAHYAAIHCPLEQTTGPAVMQSAASRHTTTPISHTRTSPHRP